jgi:hypothetical protein
MESEGDVGKRILSNGVVVLFEVIVECLLVADVPVEFKVVVGSVFIGDAEIRADLQVFYEDSMRTFAVLLLL